MVARPIANPVARPVAGSVAYPGGVGNPYDDAYLLLQGPTGVTDQGTGLNDGTFVGGMTTVADTEHSGATAFDVVTGGTSYIDSIGSTADFIFIQNTFVFTIACWVKFADASRQAYFGNIISSLPNGGFFVAMEDTPTFGTKAPRISTIRASGVQCDAHGDDNSITDTDWHHIAFTASAPGDTVKIYLDGVQLTTTYKVNFQSLGVTSDSQRVLNAGRTNGASSVIPMTSGGRLDDLAIWDRALSGPEVGLISSVRNYS